MASEIAKCQCIQCLKYLALDREPGGPQVCTECASTYWNNRGGGIPLAKIRGPMRDPVSVELLGLLGEECGEVQQRIGKLLRWGWEADHGGTTQQHKLEVELGDVIAAIRLLEENGFIGRLAMGKHCAAKLAKLREDAAGPRQRLTVSKIPKPPSY